MTCTTAQDCPSYATCCDGSDESCDGTRLPSGDATNSGEFVVSTDGLMVTDTITGLVWQRDGSGTRAGCSGGVDGGTGGLTCTWDEAKSYCAALALGGVSGWRLPGVMELRTIVDFTRASPAIDPTGFPNTPFGNFNSDSFWTGSPSAFESDVAWYVWFGNGDSSNFYKTTDKRVRCVH